ncbi:MAG: hypothetical protein AAFY58_08265, partial [Planctomycetota bacterium]
TTGKNASSRCRLNACNQQQAKRGQPERRQQHVARDWVDDVWSARPSWCIATPYAPDRQRVHSHASLTPEPVALA